MNDLPKPTSYGEENYLRACYGLISELRFQIIEKNGQRMECLTNEVQCMLEDGWAYIGPKFNNTK